MTEGEGIAEANSADGAHPTGPQRRMKGRGPRMYRSSFAVPEEQVSDDEKENKKTEATQGTEKHASDHVERHAREEKRETFGEQMTTDQNVKPKSKKKRTKPKDERKRAIKLPEQQQPEEESSPSNAILKVSSAATAPLIEARENVSEPSETAEIPATIVITQNNEKVHDISAHQHTPSSAKSTNVGESICTPDEPLCASEKSSSDVIAQSAKEFEPSSLSDDGALTVESTKELQPSTQEISKRLPAQSAQVRKLRDGTRSRVTNANGKIARGISLASQRYIRRPPPTSSDGSKTQSSSPVVAVSLESTSKEAEGTPTVKTEADELQAIERGSQTEARAEGVMPNDDIASSSPSSQNQSLPRHNNRKREGGSNVDTERGRVRRRKEAAGLSNEQEQKADIETSQPKERHNVIGDINAEDPSSFENHMSSLAMEEPLDAEEPKSTSSQEPGKYKARPKSAPPRRLGAIPYVPPVQSKRLLAITKEFNSLSLSPRNHSGKTFQQIENASQDAQPPTKDSSPTERDVVASEAPATTRSEDMTENKRSEKKEAEIDTSQASRQEVDSQRQADALKPDNCVEDSNKLAKAVNVHSKEVPPIPQETADMANKEPNNLKKGKKPFSAKRDKKRVALYRPVQPAATPGSATLSLPAAPSSISDSVPTTASNPVSTMAAPDKSSVDQGNTNLPVQVPSAEIPPTDEPAEAVIDQAGSSSSTPVPTHAEEMPSYSPKSIKQPLETVTANITTINHSCEVDENPMQHTVQQDEGAKTDARENEAAAKPADVDLTSSVDDSKTIANGGEGVEEVKKSTVNNESGLRKKRERKRNKKRANSKVSTEKNESAPVTENSGKDAEVAMKAKDINSSSESKQQSTASDTAKPALDKQPRQPEERVAIPSQLSSWTVMSNPSYLAIIAKVIAMTGVRDIETVGKSMKITGPSIQAVRTAKILLEAHLKHQVQISHLAKTTDNLHASLEKRQREVEEGLRVEFIIDRELIGLVIGRGGENLRSVKGKTGVQSVVVDDQQGIVKIYGTSKEAVEKARLLLELQSVRVPVTKEEAEYLRIAKLAPTSATSLLPFPAAELSSRLREIQSNSGVMRMALEPPSSDLHCLVHIIGDKHTVEAAKLLLRTELEYRQELISLEAQQRQLRQQINRFDGRAERQSFANTSTAHLPMRVRERTRLPTTSTGKTSQQTSRTDQGQPKVYEEFKSSKASERRRKPNVEDDDDDQSSEEGDDTSSIVSETRSSSSVASVECNEDHDGQSSNATLESRSMSAQGDKDRQQSANTKWGEEAEEEESKAPIARNARQGGRGRGGRGDRGRGGGRGMSLREAFRGGRPRTNRSFNSVNGAPPLQRRDAKPSASTQKPHSTTENSSNEVAAPA